MTERSLELFIEDIIEAINKIGQYTKNLNYTEFQIFTL